MDKVVVFPAPLGPTIPKNEPEETSRSIPATAVVSSNRLTSPVIFSTTSRLVIGGAVGLPFCKRAGAVPLVTADFSATGVFTSDVIATRFVTREALTAGFPAAGATGAAFTGAAFTGAASGAAFLAAGLRC